MDLTIQNCYEIFEAINGFYAILFSSVDSKAQKKKRKKKDETNYFALNSFKFRSVGPAFMSGRIADIAIDETNENVWYVAVGSGGVWKTENAGTTWNPIADNMPFYSTDVLQLILATIVQFG